ncbi:NADPH-dependent 7-cyano-7-deazaguanine reductase QueF [Legionella brunensis]|uniref:NADPH-dependent 7-cyano-7-deazaguanine reductase n=1 Tax=Legionella brunensis TaxID=29422 RepID=A0A0W0SLL3_9GAMM|nr:NADPH-dependent 7-cyano-7-deazaguanine reductase QueF [Legionella brunensis]KTC84227.1 GTP cyclohydrolase I PLUS perhaps regulatory protein [Legionella brunensis]
MKAFDNLEKSPLGRTVNYSNRYDNSLLFRICRKEKRRDIGLSQTLPFYGEDIWNAYELSWLNPKGKPIVALATIIVPADSSYIFESKSLKLYLNSLNSTCFASEQEIRTIIENDLSNLVNKRITVALGSLEDSRLHVINLPTGINIDHRDIETYCYYYTQEFLSTSGEYVIETLHSNLLRSNCPITNQPDWGTIFINYEGQQINHDGLLKYIISLRENHEFHEHCIERIFNDILKKCSPNKLSVYARYTRRGGIDINPWRSTPGFNVETNFRLVRQ